MHMLATVSRCGTVTITMSEPRGEFYTAKIRQEVLSRGTNDEVPLREVIAFDVMPQLIGAAYLTNDELRQRVHFHGNHRGPFLAKEAAYTRLVEVELAAGGLNRAIDAYRCGLHQALGWVSAIAMFGGPDGSRALLSKNEVERLNLISRFSHIEERLSARIWEGEVAFNPDSYTEFVREVRRLEKRRFQLHQLFFLGSSKAFEPVEADCMQNPEIGREYIDTCIAMNRFEEAAWVATELGLEEEEASLRERAKCEPKDNPRLAALLEAERAKFEWD